MPPSRRGPLRVGLPVDVVARDRTARPSSRSGSTSAADAWVPPTSSTGSRDVGTSVIVPDPSSAGRAALTVPGRAGRMAPTAPAPGTRQGGTAMTDLRTLVRRFGAAAAGIAAAGAVCLGCSSSTGGTPNAPGSGNLSLPSVSIPALSDLPSIPASRPSATCPRSAACRASAATRPTPRSARTSTSTNSGLGDDRPERSGDRPLRQDGRRTPRTRSRRRRELPRLHQGRARRRIRTRPRRRKIASSIQQIITYDRGALRRASLTGR